jgi:alpha-N-arabinofuranosidase
MNGRMYDTEPGADGPTCINKIPCGDAMIAGLTLNIFNNHCDRVRMANLAQCVNVLQAVILTKEENVLTPTYHVMEMYMCIRSHDATPSITSNNYASVRKKGCFASKDSTERYIFHWSI